MRKKLMVMSTLVVFVMLLVGGATFAYFSDSATNANNTFTAGTVDIYAVRDQGDTVPGPMFYTTAEQGTTPDGQPGLRPTGLWAPGYQFSRQLDVYNYSTTTVRLTKLRADMDPASDIKPGSAAYTEFINKMNVKVVLSGDSATLYDGPLSGLLNGWYDIDPQDIVPIAAKVNGVTPCAHLTFTCSLDSSAGNVLQGVNPVVDFSLFAQQ